MTMNALLLAPSTVLILGLSLPTSQGTYTKGGEFPTTSPRVRPEVTATAMPNAPVYPGTPMIVPQVSVQKMPNTPVFPQPPVSIHGEAASFCESTVNSSGNAAWMDCHGSLSVCTNNTCLVADGCPEGSTGVFFYGGQPAQIPMANGYLCVQPFQPALFRLAPTAAVGGRAELQLDITTAPQAGAITPGSTWYFQYWFRDTAAGGAGSNLSDGLRITFCH
jgi:hypothetical protein